MSRYYNKRLFHAILYFTSLIVIANYYLLSNSSVPETPKIVSPTDLIHFKQQLFDKRLVSYNLQYPDFFPVCNETGKPLNDRKNHSMQKILELLQTYPKQIIPYPTDYFHGRGIVLTTGTKELKYARVNLKMLELSGTKLPVQVRSNHLPLFIQMRMFSTQLCFSYL